MGRLKERPSIKHISKTISEKPHQLDAIAHLPFRHNYLQVEYSFLIWCVCSS